MLEVHGSTDQFEVHDADMLAQARAVLDACASPEEMQEAVLAAVARNEEWRGRQCLKSVGSGSTNQPGGQSLARV